MAINFLNTVAVDENVLFVDTVNDRVGIGTDSPDYLLDLYKSTATTSSSTGTTLQRLWNYVGSDLNQQKTFVDFVFQDDNDNEYPQVRIGAEVGQNGNSDTQQKEGSGAFVVYTNNATGDGPGTPTGLAERFRVDYKGNVGIGTDNPQAPLVISNSSTDGLEFHNSISSNSRIISYKRSNDTFRPLRLEALTHIFGISGNEKMRVASSGNVGIGVTAPQKKLSVYGDTLIESSGLTASLWFRPSATYNAGGIQTMKVTGSGNPYHTTISFSNYNAANVLNIVNDKVSIGTTSPSEKLEVNGNVKIKDALLSNQEELDASIGVNVIANVAIATYTAAFFDFVIKKVGNIRSGTVYACHDGTNVEFTETSTNDLGNTSDVTLSVDISGANMRLIATTISDEWEIKSLIRAI